MLAWHFVGKTLRDGRKIPEDNELLVHTGRLYMCCAGLHASIRIIDALQYAPGTTICRVKVGGSIIKEKDKLVASKRTILWRVDARETLQEFARLCALDVIHLWKAPDIVAEYLETGNRKLRAAAYAAAYAAADDAAADAAYAADAAAYAAAYAYAANAAANAAAYAAAANAAANAAAYARTKQNARLEEMIIALKSSS